MTNQDMNDRVQFTLGLEDIATNDETALGQKWINEGIIDVLTRTRPLTRVIDLVVVANTPVHDMSNQVLWLLDLQDPSGDFLERYTREDIVAAQAGGVSGYAYEEPLLWVSPVQSANTTYQAYGGFRPTPLAAPDDDPSTYDFGGLASEFHPAVLNYALWKGGEYLQHEQSQGGERWRQLYEGQDGTGGDISRIKRILSKRVSPAGAHRRDLSRNLGALSPSGEYLGG